MFLIHFKIADKNTAKLLTLKVKELSYKNHVINDLIIINPSVIAFKEIKLLLHEFFCEKIVDQEDYIYLYNFAKPDWFCEIIKKRGLKRLNVATKK
jgi:hypothetical protein